MEQSQTWKYAYASVLGTGHEKTGTPCQDACGCVITSESDGSHVLVAVVCDGAGSAAHAEEGATLARSLFLAEMESYLESGGRVGDITEAYARSWLSYFQHEVTTRAEAQGRSARDYACTFLAAVVGTENAAFLQVGDGAIIIASDMDEGEYRCVCWPQKGEYENQTLFATDPFAVSRADFSFAREKIDQLALLSDGLQRLALRYQTQEVHAPFFKPLFSAVEAVSQRDSEGLSQQLARFLASDQVNSRTDDDKSLVLASRTTDQPSLVKCDG